MPQVVRPPGSWRNGLGGSKGDLAGFLPDPGAGGRTENPAALVAEHAAVGRVEPERAQAAAPEVTS
jgi:hypothetical protein